jgi:cell division protein FtsQ
MNPPEDRPTDASPPPAPEFPGQRPPIDPRIRQRRVDVLRSRGRRRLRRILVVLGAAALIGLTVTALHSPLFSARAISVTGAHPATGTAAIVAAAGLQGHPPLISLNPGEVAGRVETLPFIASAEVERHWPDGVQIAVTERIPVLQMAGPVASWSVLDGDGRTLSVGPGRLPGLVVLIVHTRTGGVPPAPVGRSLPPSAAAGLLVSRSLPRAFAAQVVSVTVAPNGAISLALDSGITVLIGSGTDLTAKFEDVAAVLAHGSLHPTSTVDVSVPEAPTVAN